MYEIDKLVEFKPILNMIYVSAIIVNKKGNIEFINNLCENLFEYTCDEVKNKNIEIFIPDKFKEQHKKYVYDIEYENVRKHIIGKDRIVKAKTKSGKIINIDIRFNPLSFSGETMNLLLCYEHTDNEKLLKTEQMLKESYKINKIGSWEYDTISKKLFLSNEIHELINIPNNINYEDSFNFIYVDDREKVNIKISNCIQSGEAYNIICRLSELTKNNKTRYIYIKGEAIKDENKVIKILGTMQDITENINLQKELQAKTDFLAEISHEIRNPITGIMGMCSLLEENTSLDEENMEYINIIKESIKNLINSK